MAQSWNQTLTSLTDRLTGHPTSAAELYKGVDTTQLTSPERLWMDWYLFWGNPVIATGVMSFMLHEIVYFGRSIPWIIIDSMPSMRKYKLQPSKIPTAEQQWACTKLVLLSHFTVELPQIWSFHPICEYFGLQTYEVPFPPWTKMLWQIALFFVMEDTFHYWVHRAMHYGPLYKYVHKVHHEYSAPFGLAAEYAHPLEVLILGLGTIGSPFLLCYFTRDLHIVTVYIWVTLRLFQAVDAHSGYDFPISLHNWIPFWAGADHHDYHHMSFLGCYSTSFRWWDFCLGTDKGYQRTRAREAELRRKAAAEAHAAKVQ